MAYEYIKVNERYDNQVVDIILGPAPANIISAKLMSELSSEIKRITAESTSVKAIVLSGEGKHFSFGASVEEHTAGVVNDMLPKFHSLISEVLSSEVPIIAKVSGMCLGGGFELALACNMVFCNKRASFAVPEITLGVFPPPACVLLPIKVSGSVASEMILTGRNFTAEQLKNWGMVNGVAEEGDVSEMLDTFIVEHILPKSASSIRIACKAASMVTYNEYQASIKQLEDLYLKELMSTKDAVEGINSFLEKRSPKWTNS